MAVGVDVVEVVVGGVAVSVGVGVVLELIVGDPVVVGEVDVVPVDVGVVLVVGVVPVVGVVTVLVAQGSSPFTHVEVGVLDVLGEPDVEHEVRLPPVPQATDPPPACVLLVQLGSTGAAPMPSLPVTTALVTMTNISNTPTPTMLHIRILDLLIIYSL